MKRPIEPADIRKGDLIRVEALRPSSQPWGDSAHEFRAAADRDDHGWVQTRFNWYLLDRPEPAVELPTEPTLGWMRHDVQPSRAIPSSILAFWQYDEERNWLNSHDGRGFRPDRITAVTPATAVPTDALDALRDYRHGLDWDVKTPAVRRIDKFLAAVDRAQS